MGGNTADKPSFTLGDGVTWYKVSDLVFTLEDFNNYVMTIVDTDGTETKYSNIEDVWEVDTNCVAIMEQVISATAGMYGGMLIIPESGTYFYLDSECYVKSLELPNAIGSYYIDGSWKFNDILTQSGWASGDKTKTEEVTGSASGYTCSNLQYYVNGSTKAIRGYIVDQQTYGPIYYFHNSSNSQSNYWLSSSYKTINYGTIPQKISKELFLWIKQNATRLSIPYQATTITWDGDTTGRACISSSGISLYKVSDRVFTIDECATYTILTNKGDGISEAVVEATEGEHGVNLAMFYVISGFAGKYNSITIPEDGTYFVNTNGTYVTTLILPLATPDEITWDGNTDGRPCYELSDDGVLFGFYKVSNAILTLEDCAEYTISAIALGEETIITQNDSPAQAIAPNCVALEGLFVISGEAGKYVIGDAVDNTTIILPEAGTYFVKCEQLGLQILSLAIGGHSN